MRSRPLVGRGVSHKGQLFCGSYIDMDPGMLEVEGYLFVFWETFCPVCSELRPGATLYETRRLDTTQAESLLSGVLGCGLALYQQSFIGILTRGGGGG